MRSFVLAAAISRLALASPLPEDPPSGIGTGVTIAIAPPGGVPTGCAITWTGQPFGIAAVNITTGAPRRDVDTSADAADEAGDEAGDEAAGDDGDDSTTPSATVSAAFVSLSATRVIPSGAAGVPVPTVATTPDTDGSTEGTDGGDLSGFPEFPPDAGSGEVTPEGGADGSAPELTTPSGAAIPPVAGKAIYADIKAALPAADSSSEVDSTVTVRSTRTSTRTVTLNRSLSGVDSAPTTANSIGLDLPSAAVSVPKPAVQTTPASSGSSSSLGALDSPGKQPTTVIRAGVISQIEDGQIQAPVQHKPLALVRIAGLPAGFNAAGANSAESSDAEEDEDTTSDDTDTNPDTADVASRASGVPKGGPAAVAATSSSLSLTLTAGVPAAAGSHVSHGSHVVNESPEDGSGSGGSGQLEKRQLTGGIEAAVGCRSKDSLTLTLKDGVLTDSQNRIGYIASNRQFQFDGPPQAGALVTAGFSICGNGTLALGPTTTFYQCRSGDFYNLYDRNIAYQCNPVQLRVLTFKDC